MLCGMGLFIMWQAGHHGGCGHGCGCGCECGCGAREHRAFCVGRACTRECPAGPPRALPVGAERRYSTSKAVLQLHLGRNNREVNRFVLNMPQSAYGQGRLLSVELIATSFLVA
eukprot:357701-Chlamydomonas_euryale.AAC.3